MVVVIANDLPPAVRGRMKMWFIEPRPNVFVSGIKDSVADTVIEQILNHCPAKSGIIIFKRSRQAPGYQIYGMGTPQKRVTAISGLPLVIEKELMQEAAYEE